MSNYYAHPYISVEVYDNTEYTETEEVVGRHEFNGMQVGFFAGGRDNVLLYTANRTQYLSECCNPNFKKFGQAAYNVDNALATGKCGMYVMNLRPETATYANIVIMVRFKIETTPAEQLEHDELAAAGFKNEDGSASVLKYSFYAKTIEGAQTEDALLTSAIALMEDEVDENGYYNMPLFTIYTIGRGLYGNDVRLKFSNVTEYSEEFQEAAPIRHTYMLTVMEPSTDGLVETEALYGTFDEDGFDKSVSYGPSVFIDDVVNDIENGSQRIHFNTYTATFNAIADLYNKSFKAEETPFSLDIFTGITLAGTANTNLVLDTTAEDFTNLFSLDGFALSNGKDGWDDMSDEEIIASKDALLIKAYAGEIDPMIKSRFSTPCDFNLDANYSIDVKKQMAALANIRMYDLMTYLDTNLVSTTTGLINSLTALKSIYGFNVIKECHNYKWRDTNYTGKVCNMTITHWLAAHLPIHMDNSELSMKIPFCRDNAVLYSKTDYVPGTFRPIIEPDADDIKDKIYRLRANCYHTKTYNSVERSTAITSCPTNSDRLLEMNEYIIHLAVKYTYDILSSNMYQLGEETDRSQFQKKADDIINYRLAGFVKSYSVDFEMSAQDKKNSLLVMVVHLTFNTVIQKGKIKLYLDPRVDSTTTTTTTTVVEE